jgi:hypothetical protein
VLHLLAALLLIAAPDAAQTPSTDSPVCTREPACCLTYRHPNHRTCGSRSGPGCRRADGRCAYWKDGYTPDCGLRPGVVGRRRLDRSCGA